MYIILASNSPRRTEILTLANIKHTVIPSSVEEVVKGRYRFIFKWRINIF